MSNILKISHCAAIVRFARAAHIEIFQHLKPILQRVEMRSAHHRFHFSLGIFAAFGLDLVTPGVLLENVNCIFLHSESAIKALANGIAIYIAVRKING